MSKIVILGAGSMGTAFAFPAVEKKHEVFLVGTYLEDKFIDQISKKRFHSALKVKIPNKIKILKFDFFYELIAVADIIVIAVNSKGIEWAAEQIVTIKKNTNIIILTKGLSVNVNNKYEIYADKFNKILNKNNVKNYNLIGAGGPCLAKDLVSKVFTNVIYASSNFKEVKKISKLLSTNNYKISCSADIKGVEICAGIKNIYSMIVGTAMGLNSENENDNLNLNMASVVFKQAISEMIFFTKKLGGNPNTVLGLAGIGDLYVSCTGGRNAKMGKLMGMGFTYNFVKQNKMKDTTVEGAELIFDIGRQILKDFSHKQLPLMTSFVKALLFNRKFKININIF